MVLSITLKEYFMRFWICSLVVLACSSFVYSGEEKSVLVVAEPPVAVVPSLTCVGCRLYNVEETCEETCRKRLFGGFVKKQSVRKVYRPVRR
jgi:hypothetical protein